MTDRIGLAEGQVLVVAVLVCALGPVASAVEGDGQELAQHSRGGCLARARVWRGNSGLKWKSR